MLRLAALAAFCLVGLPGSQVGRAEDSREVLRIGLVNSLFRETPRTMIQLVAQPLKALMETQTGMTGEIQTGVDASLLGKQLNDNEVHLAVFHGFEFAWARQKYPDLQPLVVVSNPQRFQAYLVVAASSKINTCGDLKGKVLAIPRKTREHCYLFLERRCLGEGKDPKAFYSKVTRPADADDAVEDVLDGQADAVLIDHGLLEGFRKAKPERYSQLRVLLKSETFPTGVIAYHAGSLSDDVVRRVRDGMIGAAQNRQGRDLLKLCKMAGFEAASEDFQQAVLAILKAYPPPPEK
jgi:ABC-type phosphate/phosphonate transport system substrate-binding protein